MVSYKIARLSCAPVPLAGQDANIAQMAELVDALGSGPSGGNTVEVRVLFWAPTETGHRDIAQVKPGNVF